MVRVQAEKLRRCHVREAGGGIPEQVVAVLRTARDGTVDEQVDTAVMVEISELTRIVAGVDIQPQFR